MRKNKKIVAIAVATTACIVALAGANIKSAGIPVHRGTRAISMDKETRTVKITNTCRDSLNYRVRNPDIRPTGGMVPDGPTVCTP